MLDLDELFRSVVLPMQTPAQNVLAGIRIPRFPNHRLAKNADGAPCLLLSQQHDQKISAPIRLQNLTVVYEVPCVVTEPDGQQEHGTFTIITCGSSDEHLFTHFLRIASPLIVNLGPNPTGAAVGRTIDGLVELFQALILPSGKTVQGLWAELFIIRNAANAAMLITAWHATPEEHFDFAASSDRLEVKSSSNRSRQHYFSLSQLSPIEGVRVVVASLFVERSGGGSSIRVLCDEIRAGLDDLPEVVAQFDATFYKSIGAAWEDALKESFDLQLAKSSLEYFPAVDIPRIQNVPDGVRDVRFNSDLSAARPISEEQMRNLGGLFAAATSHR